MGHSRHQPLYYYFFNCQYTFYTFSTSQSYCAKRTQQGTPYLLSTQHASTDGDFFFLNRFHRRLRSDKPNHFAIHPLLRLSTSPQPLIFFFSSSPGFSSFHLNLLCFNLPGGGGVWREKIASSIRCCQLARAKKAVPFFSGFQSTFHRREWR